MENEIIWSFIYFFQIRCLGNVKLYIIFVNLFFPRGKGKKEKNKREKKNLTFGKHGDVPSLCARKVERKRVKWVCAGYQKVSLYFLMRRGIIWWLFFNSYQLQKLSSFLIPFPDSYSDISICVTHISKYTSNVYLIL